MPSSRLSWLGVALALAAALVLLAGCGPAGHAAAPAAQPPATTASAPANAAAVIPPSPVPGASAASNATSSAKAKGLTPSDAKSLDAQLAAIQSELDKMKAPSDSDFNAISSGLK